MAQLDSLLRIVLERQGSELRLSPGAEPMLTHGAARAPLIKRTLTAENIRFLTRQIAPLDATQEIEDKGAGVFRYAPPGLGALEVVVTAWSAETEVTFHAAPPIAARPASHPEPTPEPPPPPAGPAHAHAPDIHELLHRMVKSGASDLHLATGDKPMMRKDGDLARLDDIPPLTTEAIAKLVYPLMTERARARFEQEHDADFGYAVEGLSRFRGNAFRDRNGMGAVFRTIPNEIVSADRLGLSTQVQALSQLTKGLVLVTGPTGSGKSTTLAALLDLVNRTRADHIITIEDPIEFVHENKSCLVNQREVGEHTRDFKSALRAALREDPDVVLVGELRDLETVEIALETAETGHLVFGTLHTNTAYATVDRLIDQFPTAQQAQVRTMLSESLKAVIAQTLCKRIGGGRAAAIEVMIVNAAVSNLIREGKTFQIPSVLQTQRKQGMTMLNDALLELVQARAVDAREAYAKAVDKPGFYAAARAAGHNLDPLGA